MNTTLRICLLATCFVSIARAQRLVAVDALNDQLSTLDLVTAERSPIGVIGASIGTPSGLAYDAAADVMFCVSSSADALFTLDLTTSVATLVGPFGDPAIVMHGFELDSSTGQLYGFSAHNGGFYAIDRTSGAASLLGLSGVGSSLNLAYNTATDMMYATSTFNDSLYTVDRSNGSLTLVGPLVNSASPHGLAFHPATGVLYLVDNINDQLHAVDPATGTAWVVGSTGPGNLLSLAFIPGGTGSIERLSHGCGAATIFAHGDTRVGGEVTVQLASTNGIPVVGFGVAPTAIPFCGCTIGHEWALAFVGNTSNISIPASAALVGVQVGMQGLDLFGVGGCADPAIVLTDTLVLTIG